MHSFSAFLAAKRDKKLLHWALAAFVVWLAWTGPIRWSAGSSLPAWLLGSAPNFFAGITLTLWQAYAVPSRELAPAVVAFTVLSAVEAAQIVMPQHRADIWDLLASLVGCALAAGYLSWRSPAASPEP